VKQPAEGGEIALRRPLQRLVRRHSLLHFETLAAHEDGAQRHATECPKRTRNAREHSAK